MTQEWQELTRMTGGRDIVVQRVRVINNGVSIEGEFELPPLAQLSAEDQVFVAAFVRSHGSIKQMEATFGVSYPTIKNRLNRIGEKFEFVDVDIKAEKPASTVIDQLGKGELSVEEALDKLRKERKERKERNDG